MGIGLENQSASTYVGGLLDQPVVVRLEFAQQPATAMVPAEPLEVDSQRAGP